MIRITTDFPNLSGSLPVKSILFHGFRGIGALLVRTAKSKQQKPKTGKIYIINGKRHQASSPGEAPGVVSGKLLESTRYEMDGGELVFGAGDEDTSYAKFLELGTVKMEDRPFILESVEENFKNIEWEFNVAFSRGVR